MAPVTFAFIALGLYRWKYPGDLTDSHERWGQFGDFLGGILNPVVGMVTLVLLVRTLHSQQAALEIQSEELRLQRRELALQRQETAKSTQALADQHSAMVQQNIEQSLFTWLNSYRAIVREMTSSQHNGTGTALLTRIVETFSDRSAMKTNQPRDWRWLGTVDKELLEGATSRRPDAVRTVLETMRRAKILYEEQYYEHETELGAMLRTLYRLLSWIDKASIVDHETRWHYMAIVRAQLSQSELIIIAFNGLTHEKLAALANKYALFDNLNVTGDLLLWSLKFYFGEPDYHDADTENVLADWPYDPAAFDSDIAREALELQ